jgi:hypothetical protein
MVSLPVAARISFSTTLKWHIWPAATDYHVLPLTGFCFQVTAFATGFNPPYDQHLQCCCCALSLATCQANYLQAPQKWAKLAHCYCPRCLQIVRFAFCLRFGSSPCLVEFRYVCLSDLLLVMYCCEWPLQFALAPFVRVVFCEG